MSVLKCFVAISALVLVSCEPCYWRSNARYNVYSTKTAYVSVRGDIRDARILPGCTPISIWSLGRHGNRNPGDSTITEMKDISNIKDEVIKNFEQGKSRLCAQDIENLRKWTWNETIVTAPSFLTGVGYEELYDLGKRVRERYPHLLDTNDVEKFYFRPTHEQRTVTSAIAYVHGLTEGTNLNLPIDESSKQDDVIRPYSNCDRYQVEVKGNPIIANQMQSYQNGHQFEGVRDKVQNRINITKQLTKNDVYSLYELCRFYSSWSETLESPWCAVFDEEDMSVLEYLDDIRHYYRNGHGSWVNVKLGEMPAKDLYKNFEAAISGDSKNIVSYFTHDGMMEMFFCALGLFKDDEPITSEFRNVNRQWRTSHFAAFTTNFIAVLNSCEDTYKIQFFLNEKPLNICFDNVCSFEEFEAKFKRFADANLDFCALDEKRKTFKIIAI